MLAYQDEIQLQKGSQKMAHCYPPGIPDLLGSGETVTTLRSLRLSMLERRYENLLLQEDRSRKARESTRESSILKMQQADQRHSGLKTTPEEMGELISQTS